VKNVLGLFTNDGNIYLDAKSQYTASGLNLEIDAAVCAFDSNTANNNGNTEGGLTSYVDNSGHQPPSDSDRIRLVGSDVEKRNSAADYVRGDTYCDVRFSTAISPPPFYPSTTYSTGQAPPASLLAIVNIDTPAASAMSWFVDNN